MVFSRNNRWQQLALSLLFLCSSARALDPQRKLQQYLHDRWGAQQGFPGGQIENIAQAPDGSLWIGTTRGVIRFDGLMFHSVPPSVIGNASMTHVAGMLTDGQGSLWVRIEGNRFLRYGMNGLEEVSSPAIETSRVGFTAMAKGLQESLLLYGLNIGPIRLRKNNLQFLMPSEERPEGLVFSIAETADGSIWMGTRDAGLFRYYKGKSIHIDSSDIPDRKINALLEQRNGKLWIGTDKGAAWWDGEKVSRKGLPQSLAHYQILSMIEDRDGNVWMATNHGLLRWNHLGLEEARFPASSSDEVVTALYEDRERNIWFSTLKGLERLRDETFITYPLPKQASAKSNGPVLADSQERIWFAPSDGGLYWMKNGQSHLIQAGGLGKDVTYSIDGNSDGVWVGRQRGGLTHLYLGPNGLSVKSYTKQEGLSSNSVYTVYLSKDKSVWAGTINAGVSHLHDGQITNYSMSSGLASDTILSIVETKEGIVWFATPSGLSAFSKGQWRTYTQNSGLPSGNIECLFRDKDNILWIGTAEGLASYHSGAIHPLNNAPMFLKEPILGIVEDKKGNLWISTASRFFRVAKERLLYGAVREEDIREYTLADGLEESERVKRDRVLVPDQEGRLWLSANQGISVIDPEREAGDAAPILAHFEGVSVNGVPLAMNGIPHISAPHQRIAISYQGLSLSSPGRVRFRYRLDGVDNDWSAVGNMRQVAYSNLGPGTYKFRVIACNGEGLWNGPESTFSFVVEPAYWQTWWFRLSCAVVVCSLVGSIYRYRMLQITKQLRVRFEERLAERVRISQELHDTLLQGVLSASMQLHVAADFVDDKSEAKPLLTRVLQLMDQVAQEGRNTLRGLRASLKGICSIEEAFLQMPRELGFEGQTGYRVLVEGASRTLKPALRDELYLIGREALLNAFRHAKAKNIEVEVEYVPGHLRVCIRDDGDGIDSKIVAFGRDGHWGLSGMRERADSIGAKLKIFSRIGAGTELELVAPASIIYESVPQRWYERWLARLYFGKFGSRGNR